MNASFDIDWFDQWQTHAPNFRDGHVPVELNASTVIKLVPGPGFGDFSHPTTRMMIALLRSNSLHPTFIDIGSGSGILTLSAAALGVNKTYGIEIEPSSIEHARQNCIYNNLGSQFFLPQDFNLLPRGPVTIAMNMIRSEQKQAWNSLQQLHHLQGDLFTSGVLLEENEDYLRQVAEWGWKINSTYSLEGWSSFYFKK